MFELCKPRHLAQPVGDVPGGGGRLQRDGPIEKSLAVRLRYPPRVAIEVQLLAAQVGKKRIVPVEPAACVLDQEIYRHSGHRVDLADYIHNGAHEFVRDVALVENEAQCDDHNVGIFGEFNDFFHVDIEN